MKKLSYILPLVMILFAGSCSDGALDTAPTSKVPDYQIFENAETAQAAVNGIYRGMVVKEWSVSWKDENPGIMTTTMVKSLQGEDQVMADQGNGWFYYDYVYMVDSDNTSTSGRQYSMWNMYYALIAQTNMIIAQEDHLLSFGSLGHNVLGQAYAIRAFCYLSLYEWFCQGNYAVNKETAGVPIYLEATTIKTEGKGRGTVAELFVQINSDFDKSIQNFEATNEEAPNNTHIDMYTAYGLWARAALIQEDWGKVTDLTAKGLSRPGLARVASMADLTPINKVDAPSIMWGFEMIGTQTGPFGPFLSHMDPEGGYGKSAPQCIDAWLWNQIPETDKRKTAWWENGDKKTVRYYPYCQLKFRLSALATSLGDIQYLRAEELILMAAEAACRMGEFGEARELLTELGAERDPAYAERLKRFQNSAVYNTDTHGDFVTLMDEILFQRRVELWCEGFGRAYDLRRLNLGFDRDDYEGSNHPDNTSMKPGAYEFTALLPQKEFDSNSEISIADQNPR